MDHDESALLLNKISAMVENGTSQLGNMRLDDTMDSTKIRTKHHCRSQAHRRITELRQNALEASKSGKTYLGHVYAASGYRQARERWSLRLDWALIEIEESRAAASKVRLKEHSPAITRINQHQGQNTLCDRAGFPVDKSVTDLCPGYQKDCVWGKDIYKFGRTTKGTEGKHGIFSVIYHHQGV